MIIVRELNKSYENLTVIKDMNLEIAPGSICAIMGRSGSGKSTLLNILGLLDNDFSGNVTINGADVKGIRGRKRQKFIRNNINYMFQNFALIDDKTVEYNLNMALRNVKMTKHQKNVIVDNILMNIDLSDKKDKKVFTLSGGEQQRVALARSLIKPGNILLADEPTGNLDGTNRLLIMELIRRNQNTDKIVVIVTHDEEVASMCDRVLRL